jgi:hypothetical protein
LCYYEHDCLRFLLKKIDLHIHTVSTRSDPTFTFSLDTFKRYVESQHLDAVAVTNHDMFDAAQFRDIQSALGTTVYPGIEINVDGGHVLIISSPSELSDFETKTGVVATRIRAIGESISADELKSIFGDLNRYLVIPHYDKAPPLTGESLEKLMPYICAGEVDSAKKFTRAMKDPGKPTPVLFSDARMSTALPTLPARQTYVDCGTPTLSALKECLRDRTKVALSPTDGNKLWQVFPNGQMLSTGLNVVIGSRSSGKTHALNAIKAHVNEASPGIENVKYIRQFALVQQNDESFDRDFSSDLERRKSVFADAYLSGLKRIVEKTMMVDSAKNTKSVERYVETLVKSATETDRRDAFSKASLFDEVEYQIEGTKGLDDLFNSVRNLIENVEFRHVIQKHVDIASLRMLARELIELLRDKALENKTKDLVNAIVRDAKGGLRVQTSAQPVEHVDLYSVCMDQARIDRFNEIVNGLRKEAVILDQPVQGFRVEARRRPFTSATDIKTATRTKTSLVDAYRKYGNPYEYLRALMADENLHPADLFKLFVKISYTVMNSDGVEVSGGERSEYRLLQEIADAQNFEILLIDEPESSFDNVFLRERVNRILKGIAETMPVVVVTHNNTVGASVGADYLIYTSKTREGSEVKYRIFAGYPTDATLKSVEGESVENFGILMTALEAGVEAYEGRRRAYEAVKGE